MTTVIGPLELCPFCGAPARVEYSGVEADMIWCGGNDCHLQPILWFCNFDSIAETAAAWNRRAPFAHAQAIEARRATTTGVVEDESAAPKGCAQTGEQA